MKPYAHQAITRIALNQYAKRHDCSIPTEFYDAVVYGVKAEDHMWEMRRWINWHFFRQNDRIRSRYYLVVRTTSEDIFCTRVATLLRCFEKVNRGKFGRNLGRVLHHIQDMYTPSHIIPIFHLTNDYFESFMEEALQECKIHFFPYEDPLMVEDNSFCKFYESSAEDTYRFVHETEIRTYTENRDKYFDLTLFWKDHTLEEDPKRVGFGTFGEAQKLFKKKSNGQYDMFFIYEGEKYRMDMRERYRICELVVNRAIAGTVNVFEAMDLKHFLETGSMPTSMFECKGSRICK